MILSGEKFKELFSYPNYGEFRREGQELLTLSRSVFAYPDAFFKFQRIILERIINLENAIKKNGCKKGDSDFLRIKYLIRTYKFIMDGIALRLMGFDQESYRLLSENRDSGHLNNDGLSHELSALEKSLESGKPTILNGITNFIRFGDLTVFDKQRIELVEIKTKKSKMSSQKSIDSDQDIKRKQIEKMLNEGTTINGEKINPFFLPFKSRSYKGRIMSLIKKANKDGFAFSEIDEFIKVFVINPDNAKEKKLNIENLLNGMPIFPESDIILTSNNGDYAYSENSHFLRSIFPSTVFPMPASIIVDMLYFRVIVHVSFNLTRFLRAIEMRGFKVEFDPKKYEVPIDQKYNNKILPFELGEASSGICISKSGWNMELSAAAIPEIRYEYIKADSFIDLVECCFRMHGTPALRKPGKVIPIFENHIKMWK